MTRWPLLGGLLAAAVVFFANDGASAQPHEARIPLDQVLAVYVKEYDGSWKSYIPGAPTVVNRAFTERYILSVPPPTPTPAPLTTPTTPDACTAQHVNANIAWAQDKWDQIEEMERSGRGGSVSWTDTPFPMCDAISCWELVEKFGGVRSQHIPCTGERVPPWPPLRTWSASGVGHATMTFDAYGPLDCVAGYEAPPGRRTTMRASITGYPISVVNIPDPRGPLLPAIGSEVRVGEQPYRIPLQWGRDRLTQQQWITFGNGREPQDEDYIRYPERRVEIVPPFTFSIRTDDVVLGPEGLVGTRPADIPWSVTCGPRAP